MQAPTALASAGIAFTIIALTALSVANLTSLESTPTPEPTSTASPTPTPNPTPSTSPPPFTTATPNPTPTPTAFPDGTVDTINVEVYFDSSCTQPVTSLSMGNVSPDSTVTQTIYILNSGTIPVTLTMLADDWNPTAASSYLDLSWNRQNYVLDAEDSVSANLTLSVSSDIAGVKDFSCTVTFTGTE